MQKKNMNLSRRALLKSMSGLAIAAPLARLVAKAQAAPDTGPLPRLLLIATEHAASSYWWRPQGDENTFSLDFPGAVLAPFADLKSKLLVLNGVGAYVAADELLKGVEGHGCRAVTFTGLANNVPSDPNKARGPSVDQLIISHLGETRPLHASIGNANGSEYYFNSLGSQIAGVSTARGIFDALFGDAAAGGSTTDPSAVALREYARTLLAKQLADAQTLQRRVGPSAKVKIDEYLSSIQARITSLDNAASGQVTLPSRPAQDPAYGQPLSSNGPFDRLNLELDLVADGLSLGMTQVACLRLDHGILEDHYLGQSIAVYDNSGNFTMQRVISDTHQHVSHAVIWGDQYRDLAPNLMSRDIQRAYSFAIARLLKRLDSVRDVDGSSVLDNTLVVYTGQMSDTISHGGGRLPFVLAGGLGQKAGTFRMGRYLNYLGTNLNDFATVSSINTAVPHNLLLNSVLRTFGIVQDSFGDAPNSRCVGYLPRAV